LGWIPEPLAIRWNNLIVMAGLVPATHERDGRRYSWVAGTPRFALRPAMT
jgi:hypothetical protein